MKIFISWSGERSQKLAEALRKWLPLVLPYVTPWVSKSDIQAGERWSLSVANELQESKFGIICVTKDNMNAPWILFESGAIPKSMEDGRVIPLLLDLEFKDISGPLTQFQAKKAEEEGIRELIIDLNKAAASPEPEDTLSLRFEGMFAWLRERLDEIPTSGTQKQNRPQGEILEELVSSVRGFESRFRDVMDEEPSYRRKSKRRMHPGMLMDLTHGLAEGPNDPTQLLIVFSLFKDDAPWLYELAVDLYHAICTKDRSRARAAQRRLRRAIDLTTRGPLLDFMGSDKMTYMLMRDVEEFVPLLRSEAAFDEMIGQQPPVRRKRPSVSDAIETD